MFLLMPKMYWPDIEKGKQIAGNILCQTKSNAKSSFNMESVNRI